MGNENGRDMGRILKEREKQRNVCMCVHACALNMAGERGSDSGKHLLGGGLHPLLSPPWPNLES